jgi:hypothetical protein
LEVTVDADLDTLATALYVRIDDELKMRPELARPRPEIGLCPRLSDAELLTLAVIHALLGFSSETRFLRHASVHLRHLFPSRAMDARWTPMRVSRRPKKLVPNQGKRWSGRGDSNPRHQLGRLRFCH